MDMQIRYAFVVKSEGVYDFLGDSSFITYAL